MLINWNEFEKVSLKNAIETIKTKLNGTVVWLLLFGHKTNSVTFLYRWSRRLLSNV